MHGELSSILDDAALLEEWVTHCREAAFAELVEKYQKLVLAAAMRRTGNPESAQDVAQQVFALLAAKAPLLIGRRSIAGWLYYVASHLGARTLRTERRRAEAHSQAAFPRECTGSAEPALWGAVEDGMAALGEADREAIVLHYLQDLSYAEMATTLGISEAAARKRVSRALQSLEGRLRTRGVGRPAAAILATVAAQQGATATSSATGLAVAAVASSPSASIPLSILMSTVTSHTSTKVASTLAALCLVPLTFQWNANAHLREEIAAARTNLTIKGNGAEAIQPGSLAQLRGELAAKQSAIVAAENRTAELAELKRKLETEVVYSMGTIESMARELAHASKVTNDVEATQSALQKARAADPASEESKRLEAELKELALKAAALLPRGITLLREVLKTERSPEKAARFYATYLAESSGLDETTRAALETRLQSWVTDLQRSGLALPQRPKTIERVEWDQRRADTTKAFVQTLATDFPNVKWDQLPLDQHLGGGKDSEWFDMFLTEDNQR